MEEHLIIAASSNTQVSVHVYAAITIDTFALFTARSQNCGRKLRSRVILVRFPNPLPKSGGDPV